MNDIGSSYPLQNKIDATCITVYTTVTKLRYIGYRILIYTSCQFYMTSLLTITIQNVFIQSTNDIVAGL